ncbi:unnamed protein product, partial [Discosporangium mesarthrocarpum]
MGTERGKAGDENEGKGDEGGRNTTVFGGKVQVRIPVDGRIEMVEVSLQGLPLDVAYGVFTVTNEVPMHGKGSRSYREVRQRPSSTGARFMPRAVTNTR